MFTTNSTSPTEPRRRGTSQSPSAGGNSASPGFVQPSHIHNNVVGEDGRPSKSPEQCLKEDQSAAKRAKERDIKKFMEWLDDLDTDGVVHALDLFGVSEEAREAVEESDVDGETWAALFSQKLDRYMISDMVETYKLKKEDVIMFKRKFDAYYPQHDSREVKVTDKVAPGKEGTKEEKIMELSRPRGICHQFRDTGKCNRGDRCHFEHKPGTVPCTNAAYLDTGCCSEHLTCPCVHKFDESKHGPKHLAVQRMLQGVREGKYHAKPGDHVYWLQEHSMPYNEEGEEKNKGG